MRVIDDGDFFDLEEYDPERCAGWLLELVDSSPDKLAIVKMPVHENEAELDQLEEMFRDAYDVAKAERPDLSVKMLLGVAFKNGVPRDRVAVAVHEHRWVGGQCVNGCPDTLKAG